MTRQMPELLTVTQVAARLGVTEATIRNWLRRGRCPAPALAVGCHRFWSADQVIKFTVRKGMRQWKS